MDDKKAVAGSEGGLGKPAEGCALKLKKCGCVTLRVVLCLVLLSVGQAGDVKVKKLVEIQEVTCS